MRFFDYSYLKQPAGPKLHLGCGERYFEGYINIDYPPSEHTVQQKSVADQYADLLALRYPVGTIAEVRLHHVFEHFSRPVACALLASWNAWLAPGGLLHIEVPDFEEMARTVVRRWSSNKQKHVALRHIFGSQEAAWAVHYNGYTANSLTRLLKAFGFRPTQLHKNRWRRTTNIEIRARKIDRHPDIDRYRTIARAYLSQYLLDQGSSESRLLEIWMNLFDTQLMASCSTEGA